jgi:hypothetical protein
MKRNLLVVCRAFGLADWSVDNILRAKAAINLLDSLDRPSRFDTQSSTASDG